MNEGALNEIKFNDNMPTDRWYEDRFVFPEALLPLYKDNRSIVEAIKREIDNRIKEKTINNFSNEVILKNIAGPFFDDLSDEEKKSLIKVIGEMRVDMTKSDQEEAPTNSNLANKRKAFKNDELEKMMEDARRLLENEAVRTGDVPEVDRKSNGDIYPKGDAIASEARILEINDADEEVEEIK